MDEIQTKKVELTYSENMQRAANLVAKWPAWKIQNMKAVFSEPDIKVPQNKKEGERDE